MPRLSALLFALPLLLLAACGGGRDAAAGGDDFARIKAAKVIRVGVKADTQPFGFNRGGQLTGFDIDIAQALARELGVEAELVPVTSKDRLERLLEGEIDCVIASTTITRGREQQVDFTIPYFQDGQALLVKKASAVKSYLDLADRKVGAVDGSTSAANIALAAPEATLVKAANFPALLTLLDEGAVEAITSDQLILQGLAIGSGKGGDYRIAGDRFSVEPYGIAVRPNQSRLRDALNDGLQNLWESGRWQLINDTWFGPASRFHTRHGFSVPLYPR